MSNGLREIVRAVNLELRTIWPGHRFSIGIRDGMYGSRTTVEVRRGGWEFRYDVRGWALNANATELASMIAGICDAAWTDAYNFGF